MRSTTNRRTTVRPGALISLVASIGLLTATCSSDSLMGVSPASTVSVAETPQSAVSVSETSDLVYLTMDGVELALDVIAPERGGPWPVVVAFHGRSSAGKDAEGNTLIPEAAAASGMMVVTPTWYSGDPFPLMIDDLTMMRDAGNCAVAFAQQIAPRYGGDASATVVYGFSAGTGPALTAALAPRHVPVPGCATDALPAPITGVVLGDGEYFWQSENFDGAFAADLEAMQSEVALLTDSTRWEPGLEAEFHLWAAAEGTAPRVLDSAAGADDWLTPRDPDGSIRSDLDRLGELDDGIIDYLASARLLELRLAEAGLDVDLDVYPGGHTTLDKVPQLVDALTAATTD